MEVLERLKAVGLIAACKPTLPPWTLDIENRGKPLSWNLDDDGELSRKRSLQALVKNTIGGDSGEFPSPQTFLGAGFVDPYDSLPLPNDFDLINHCNALRYLVSSTSYFA